jgi:hypothetical protein
LSAALAVIILAGLIPALADAQANFYQGKTITLLATRAAGGTGGAVIASKKLWS